MKRLIGGILIAAGILIGGASGICSLVVAVSFLGQPDSFEGLPLVALFGGIPMLIGLGLYKWGRKLVREADAAGHDEFG